MRDYALCKHQLGGTKFQKHGIDHMCFAQRNGACSQAKTSALGARLEFWGCSSQVIHCQWLQACPGGSNDPLLSLPLGTSRMPRELFRIPHDQSWKPKYPGQFLHFPQNHAPTKLHHPLAMVQKTKSPASKWSFRVTCQAAQFDIHHVGIQNLSKSELCQQSLHQSSL